ncbi:recombination-associated protein RdgC (plasmid) [Vibrio alginolyticus]|uniref:recombination-associated protein RdgC n=1 Tax=Vibrio alginolyticus TaxID=663 RepID=UPI0015937FC8|nr:recombination-associated protein RdgC [Vibrio alginolyticus]QKS98270.1 recombination-associated protein RdgC [Vibrio alginolyticus]
MKPFSKGVLYAYPQRLESAEVMTELKKLPLEPTSASNPHTCGFVNVEHDFHPKGDYLKKLFGQVYVSTFAFEKRAPSTLQVDILEKKKIKAYQETLKEGESVTQKKRREIRREAKRELVSQVDPQQSYVCIAWDFGRNQVIIDTTNKKELTTICDKLATSDINLTLEKLSIEISGFLTDIIDRPNETLTDEFDVGDNVTMADHSKVKATVNYQNQEITNDEIEQNRTREKTPVAVGLLHKDAVSFVLTIEHTIKSLKVKNTDKDYILKLLENVSEIEMNEPEKQDYFQKMAALLMMLRNIFEDVLKMKNSSTSLMEYLESDDS